MNQKFNEWKANVKAELESLKAEIDNNETAKSLYNGFYVFDSKFIENPKIMFIGINPGDGNPKNNRSIDVEPKEDMSYLEYWDEGNASYAIARDTIKTLELAGLTKDEIRHLLSEQSVKTNFYYIITKDQSNIKQCLNFIAPGKFNDFYLKSMEWTKELIRIVNPKAIICEGSSVFKDIEQMLGYENLINDEGCSYAKTQDYGYFVIGYERTYSNIKNKEKLAEILKRFVV
jgi:hypothetical protein